MSFHIASGGLHIGSWLSYWILVQDNFNAALAQAEILESPNRGEIQVRHTKLSNFLSEAEQASQLLLQKAYEDLEEYGDILSIATSTDAAAEHYTLVEKALNALLTHGQTAKGPALAQKITAHNAKDDTAQKLPRCLQVACAALAEGDRSAIPVLTPQVKGRGGRTVGKKCKAEEAASAAGSPIMKQKRNHMVYRIWDFVFNGLGCQGAYQK